MRVYTMANDAMIDVFRRFLRYREAFCAAPALYVIPFDDDLEQVREAVADADRAVLVEPDPRFDEWGKRVFADREYRPGVPAWRYLRKLNCMQGHDAPAAFFDANAMILCDVESVLPVREVGPDEIYFRARSVPRRTIRSPLAARVLEQLSPGTGAGFNCGNILFRGGFLDMDVAERLVDPRLVAVIGKAPEQGFLTYYAALAGKRAALIQDLRSDVSSVQGDADALELGADGLFRYATGSDRGRVCIAIKHVGPKGSIEPENVRAAMEDRIAA